MNGFQHSNANGYRIGAAASARHFMSSELNQK
jgi:hypothetical protein